MFSLNSGTANWADEVSELGVSISRWAIFTTWMSEGPESEYDSEAEYKYLGKCLQYQGTDDVIRL